MYIKRILVVLFLSVTYFGQAQSTDHKKWVKVGGFVNYNLFYDSRQTVAAVDGLFLLYPENEEIINGVDVNANPSLTMLSLASRLRADFKGPEVFGASTQGKIEADFTLVAGASTIRFRHAYISLNWSNFSLLAGRTWHPLFVEQCFPSTIGIATGAPFQPFSRTPQLRADYRFRHFNFQLAIVSQMDYASDGPFGRSPNYMRQAVVPELSLRVAFQNQKWLLGLVADIKTLKPRLTTEGTSGTFKASETLSTYTLKLYGKYLHKKWEAKTSVMVGQNLSDVLLAGGYGVSAFDSLTGKETYTPLSGHYSWINVLYGEKLKVGIFGGYYKNLGSTHQLVDSRKIWGRGLDIDQMIRIMPTLFYKLNDLQLGFEFEWDRVYYGDLDQSNGIVTNTHKVNACRISADVTYFF